MLTRFIPSYRGHGGYLSMGTNISLSLQESWHQPHSSIKWWKCKNFRNTPKLSFQRRQRVSQAKKRYNYYTENIVIVMRLKLWKRDSDVPEVIMKRTQQEAQANQLSIALQRIDSKKPRLQQLSTNLSCSGLLGVQFPLGIVASCVFMFKYLMYTL